MAQIGRVQFPPLMGNGRNSGCHRQPLFTIIQAMGVNLILAKSAHTFANRDASGWLFLYKTAKSAIVYVL